MRQVNNLGAIKYSKHRDSDYNSMALKLMRNVPHTYNECFKVLRKKLSQ